MLMKTLKQIISNRNMKTRLLFVFALCALLQSCGMADAQVIWLTGKNMDFTNCDSESRDVKPFNAISNSVPFDLIYEQSDERYVVVEGDGEYFDRLHTDVVRGTLMVTMDRGRYRNIRLRIRVSCPEIEMIAMNGSGDLICSNEIETDGDLTIRIAGSGDITTQKISCANLKASVAGSGDISIPEIECDGKVEISVAGSGDYRSDRVNSGYMSVSVAGSGDIRVSEVEIDEDLSASIAGSGDIRMNGCATNVEVKIVGSGDVWGDMRYEHISKNKAGSGSIMW